MQVAIFHPAFQALGGAELLASMQAAYFQSQGITVKVVTFAFASELWQERFGGVAVERVRKRHWTDLFSAWTRVAKMRRRARRAAAHVKGCDVVLAHNYPCSAMLGAARIPARSVWQCNEPPRRLHMRAANPFMTARLEATGGSGAEDACAAFAPALRAYDGAVARRRSFRARQAFDVASVRKLDEVYAISTFSRDNVRRIYGRCREQVIPPMVRFPAHVEARSGLDRSGLRVLVHSRLDPWKNIDTVLRGFACFRATRCPQAELHVVGEGGDRCRLETLATELCPRECVQFHGVLTDAQMRAVYRRCDALALLPIDEPFGMVFPEAAAHGLLLVGPNHGGPMEILDGGRFGWTCDAFSPDALAECLAQIWAADDAAVDRLRAEADRACRARYAPEVVGARLLTLLRELA